jgi:hypothetical protein
MIKNDGPLQKFIDISGSETLLFLSKRGEVNHCFASHDNKLLLCNYAEAGIAVPAYPL